MKKTQGFTLIELLVVVAIIGILATVVLASLGSARNKGKDSSIAASLSSIRAQAEIYALDNAGTYTTICTTSQTAAMYTDATGNAPSTGTNVCADTATAWAAAVQMNKTSTTSGNEFYFCVDSTGFAGERDAASNPITADTDLVC